MKISVLIVGLAIAAPARAQSVEDWSRVVVLKPGTRVIVTAQDSPRVQREFVAADGSTLTLRTVSPINGPAATVETIARSTVVEIRTTSLVARRGILGRLGPAGSFFGGVLLGGITGSVISKAAGADPSDVRGVFWGSMGGVIAGGVLGVNSRRVQEEVIYRRELLLSLR